MTRRRLAVLWVAVAIIIAIAIVPPWKTVRSGMSGIRTAFPYGYAPIWDAPSGSGLLIGYSIDWSRLALEWIVVVVLAGATMVTMRERKRGG